MLAQEVDRTTITLLVFTPFISLSVFIAALTLLRGLLLKSVIPREMSWKSA